MTGRGRREPSHEVEIQLMCGWPGQPHHGEQLLIWAAKDLTGATEGIYLKGGTDNAWRWHDVKGSDGFIRPADYSAKLDPRCLWSMPTPDQLLYSALHGTAMRLAAERRNLDESIEELSQLADSRNDILAEAAGITAGSWYASPATHVGYELIGAGMLILAGGGRGLPLDYDGTS
jgi:hypothetical protein